MKQKNLSKRIEMIENTAVFKSFLQRIGFHNYEEYMKLFGENIFKRKVTTDRCMETYPDLLNNKLQQGKD